MSGPQPGDIVVTPAGRKWRVLTVTRDIVRAQELETGVVSHLDVTTLTIREKHPGGAGGEQR